MYEERIQQIASDYDTRHVLAYMLVGHSTLDGLSQSEFDAEVRLSCECILEGGNVAAERVARSFGL